MGWISIRICAGAILLALFGGFPSTDAAAQPPVVVFGGDLNYPPYEWSDNGTPRGFLIDIEDAMGRAGGATASHRLAPWPDTISALKSGAVDVVPMFKSDEREKDFWFSRPVFFAHHAIFTRLDPGRATDLAELRTWRVVVEGSSFAHDQFAATAGVGELILVGNTQEALAVLTEGGADYAVLAEQPAARLIFDMRLPVSRVGAPFWPREYGFAVLRDRAGLIAWVERSLDAVIASGEFQRIQADWQAELDAPVRMAPRWLGKDWEVLAALIALGFGTLLFVLVRIRSALRDERGRRSAAESDASFLLEHDLASGLPRRRRFEAEANCVLNSLTGGRLKLIALRTVEIQREGARPSSTELAEAQSLIGECLTDMGFASGYLCERTFAALVSAGTAHGVVESIAQRLQRAGFDAEFAWGGARFPEHGHDAHDLLKRAELALAACSASGRKWAMFDGNMQPGPDDARLVRDFLSFGKNDIFAVYQPQLDLRSGRITGAEALVRWNHRDLGSIPPDQFIPQLEQAGLVGEVTMRMIDEAIKLGARFRAKGYATRVSVNVSAQDFADRDLPELVEARLRDLGGRPEDLTIELTESGAVSDPELVRETLARLQLIGVRAAIDDFGTGFASLASFTELPFQELKIDRLFVERMNSSPGHREAVSSAINMARRMKMEVVAEGAPDLATIELLKRMRCTRVQSFAVSPPLGADELFSFSREFALHEGLPGTSAGSLRLAGG